MQPRQIIAVLIAFIVILGAALFVVTWTSSDNDEAATVTTTSTVLPPTTLATTSTSTTTTTTIPVDCGTTESASTSATTSSTTSSTTAPDATTTIAAAVVATLGINSSVSTVGLDSVNFGMTVAQAETAAGTAMLPCTPKSECYRVTPLDAPEGISFVVTDGTIERVDIASGPITTKSGVGIGTAEARIIELFGSQIERSVNDDSSVDLIFVPTDEHDAKFRVIFTIRDGVVETFRSGRVPQVTAPDPCAT